MLGPIGSNLMNFLRLLTPYEVNRLTQRAQEKESIQSKIESSVDLSTSLDSSNVPYDNLNKDQSASNSEGAKILAFDHGEANQKAKTEIHAGPEQANLKVLLQNKKAKKSRLKKKVSGLDFIEEEEEEVVETVEITETEFLVSQKEKLKNSNLKMIGKEAITSYRKQASVDTSHEDTTDLSQSSTTGILVNKRQF